MESHLRQAPTQNISWNLMFFCGIIIYGSHGVLLNICKVNGKIPFNSISVVFFIELCKLLISIVMLLPEAMEKQSAISLPGPKQFLMFSVPAILYSINNNIVVHVQSYVDPASFQVLSNLKIVCIAVLYRVLLKRPVAKNKWIAITMITVAGAFNSYGGWLSSQDVTNASENKIHVTFLGVMMILIYCCISGGAGIYTEYILKKQAKFSLPVQGVMLYSFGAAINFSAFCMSQFFLLGDERSYFKSVGDMFKGFSIWTIIIIFTQAINGIIMGAIMKYASNLSRLLLIAGAMLVSTSLSVLIFSLEFNEYFIVAFILVTTAMFIYHK